MSRTSFENYGRLAASDHHHTVIAGRYLNQLVAEKLIPLDVMEKLDLGPKDSLLEIGCGTGNILIPLSFIAGSSSGLDHSSVIGRLAERLSGSEIQCFMGNFLDTDIDGEFSKILIYSVVHCLSDEDEVLMFLDKALGLLAAGGKLLIGDIPNVDLKAKFLASSEGKVFQKAWETEVESAGIPDLDLPEDTDTIEFNDAVLSRIQNHLKLVGYQSERMGQPQELPFGHTREDLLAWRDS